MSAIAIQDEQQSFDGNGALLWLELLEGTTRERLIERLAQAHLTAADQPEPNAREEP